MKQYTLGNYTLDDFADFLKGTPCEQFVGIEGNELLLTGEHTLTKQLELHFPITIVGDNATVTGTNDNIYLANITANNTTISGLKLVDFQLGIAIDGSGKHVDNVSVNNVHMTGGMCLVDVGSTASNSTLSNVHIDNCTVLLDGDAWGDDTLALTRISYNICCARHPGGGQNIDNCLLENVYVNNCSKLGESRCALNYIACMPTKLDYSRFDTSFSNLTTRNLNFTNNNIELCWDGGINVVGSFCNTTGSVLLDGVNIVGNTVTHGIAGVYMFSGEPMFGACNNTVVSNVVIKDNTFTKGVADVGEPMRGIWLSGVRGDFFPGISLDNNIIEGVEITDNKLDGSGIVICGAYTLLDGQSVLSNNAVKNVNIHNNYISNADVAFQFDGVQLEGRLYDWNFGFPRHDKAWGEAITDDSIVTAVATNNCVENIICTNNTIEGYRYRVVASGANAHGHGQICGNKVCGNIVFENNAFGVGENHLHVADVIADDFVVDNGGNKVSMLFKQKK